MHPKKFGPILVLSMVGLAAALAGCTGQFDIEQTEPFRVQIEDGEARTVQVSADDDEPERIIVENDNEVERIDVRVVGTPQTEGRTVILVTIVNEDTDEVFAEQEIVLRDDTTGDNETDNGTDDGDGTITQVIQNIDIRGSNNFVVLTQGVEGDAEVDITTTEARGNSQVNVSDDEESGDGNQTSDDDSLGDVFGNDTVDVTS